MKRPKRVQPGRPASPAAPPHRNGRPETAPRVRVLVVDDHADTRDLLVTILKTEGYEVDLADDGDLAIQRYRERPADIVLMDLYMPRQDGVTTIRQLHAEFPGVVAIAMSGDGKTIWRDALAEARAAGAQLTLRKPIEPWVLLRALEGLVAGRKTFNGLHRSA